MIAFMMDFLCNYQGHVVTLSPPMFNFVISNFILVTALHLPLAVNVRLGIHSSMSFHSCLRNLVIVQSPNSPFDNNMTRSSLTTKLLCSCPVLSVISKV